MTDVFPPALVPILRDRLKSRGGNLSDTPDDLFVRLLTTVFWAGLETYEGGHNAIGAAYLGANADDFIVSKDEGFGTAPIYDWKIMRFDSPRPFVVSELVKLAVAGVNRRIYTAVGLRDGQLVVSGLAREGFNLDPDPFIKVVAPRPGSLSIRCGRHLLLGYERGAILSGGEGFVFSEGPVRRALEATAHGAGLHEKDVIPDYVDAVRALVRQMAEHGKGGILIIGTEECLNAAAGATYRMTHDSSLASLFRLARRLNHTKGQDGRLEPRQHTDDANPSAVPGSDVDRGTFRTLLRNAFLTETERVIERIGALTAIDGAILLNRELTLIAFGLVLPIKRQTAVAEAMDVNGVTSRIIDFGSRGTRHRAAASYATEHPGSVVFVASEDGPVSCLLRDPSDERPLLWRLSPDVLGTG